MLVLSRYRGQSIVVDGPCEIMIVSVRDGKVRVGVTATKEVTIKRTELLARRQQPTEDKKVS